MYKKVGELSLPKTEESVLKFWKENDVKQKCLNENSVNYWKTSFSLNVNMLISSQANESHKSS